MTKEWFIAPAWPECREAARTWNVQPLIAQILYNREITTSEEARAFLSPKLNDLHDPATLPGAEPAAEHIARAVRERKRIAVYGDYDVDGITGAAILWHLIRLCGGEVDLYIPHRLEEGYGINCESLRKLHEDGVRMVISVDCGITAFEAAQTARNIGLELIITDHHTPHGELPECVQIVHPTAVGECPNPFLCGAGVAFKLAWVIAQKISGGAKVEPHLREFLLNATGLAALGTIADIVSLKGENRIISRFGLAGLPHSTIIGVQSLIDSAGLNGQAIDSYAVGFKLAPRINAAGRMGHARLALDLLTRASEPQAREIAQYLEEQNRARQSMEKKIFRQARDMVHHHGMDRSDCRAIVLAHENWHAGVIGIVASRLVEEFHRPAVLIAMDNGIGQGSARSIQHFELNRALEQCSGHLLTFGGHRMAAGLTIESERIPAFREDMVDHANNRLTAKDLIPRLRIDAQVRLDDFDRAAVRMIQNLGPFGLGNPRPRLATDWLDLDAEPRCVGKAQNHLQFAVREEQTVRKAIAFRMGQHLQQLRDHRRCRLAFQPIINSYRGYDTVELQVDDIQFPENGEKPNISPSPTPLF